MSSLDNLTLQIVAAVLATALVYTILPGIGYVIFKHWSKAGLCAVLTVVWTVPLAVIIRKLFPKESASR